MKELIAITQHPRTAKFAIFPRSPNERRGYATNEMMVSRTVLLVVILLGSFGVFSGELLALFDLYLFEFPALFSLLGTRGVTVLLILNIGLLLLSTRAFYALLRRRHPYRFFVNTTLVLSTLTCLWVLEYLFMETPLTTRAAFFLKEHYLPTNIGPVIARTVPSFSLTRNLITTESSSRLRIMYDRIRVNNPQAYRAHPLGPTIDKYATRYQLDPALLFFLNYIDSFYGEAASGPVPFLRSMTAETIRDLVQVHLPGWFIEGGIRRGVLSSTFFRSIIGANATFKLQYALHKATLDVSVQPYALNTYSDTFLVLKEYPEAFPDILSGNSENPIINALRTSFFNLRNTALRRPYEFPYRHPPYGDSYYDANRLDLKRFARAAFYLTILDFDFATRVQALLSRYQRDYYKKRLGIATWNALPHWQQVLMLAMIRDLYTPNVGTLSYNLYALPELNCTPLEFVASQAVVDLGTNQPPLHSYWRPNAYLSLWAGAAYRIRVLNEVWSLVHGTPIPGLRVEQSARTAAKLLSVLPAF